MDGGKGMDVGDGREGNGVEALLSGALCRHRLQLQQPCSLTHICILP